MNWALQTLLNLTALALELTFIFYDRTNDHVTDMSLSCWVWVLCSLFYHSRQPRLPLELSHWLRAVEYLRCYPRLPNLGYLFSTHPESRLSVFKYSVFTTFQISNTEERGQTAFITPLLSCSVPRNICNRGYTGIVSKIQNCVDQ